MLANPASDGIFHEDLTKTTEGANLTSSFVASWFISRIRGGWVYIAHDLTCIVEINDIHRVSEKGSNVSNS